MGGAQSAFGKRVRSSLDELCNGTFTRGGGRVRHSLMSETDIIRFIFRERKWEEKDKEGEEKEKNQQMEDWAETALPSGPVGKTDINNMLKTCSQW